MARCVATQTISRRRLWGVWTGEHDGVAIRSPIGKLLGLFNAKALVNYWQGLRLAKFAIAGDRLVILALDRLSVLQLGQSFASAAEWLS